MIQDNITKYSYTEARKFFLKSESYCSFNLPPYFVFDDLINKVANEMETKFDCKTWYNYRPSQIENINYSFFHNKDGLYSWRRLQLIHPVLYVHMVNIITDQNNWKAITERFQEFSNDQRIKCVSIPAKPMKNSQVATSIKNWLSGIEQETIKLSLDYRYLLQTDITTCYDSIYTHSVPWALHNKDEAKKNKEGLLFGNRIDKCLQYMSYGQTNGIPQGSILMDFIAEIVLGYADLELSKKLNKELHFKILRYRDDYRIFVNSSNDADIIVKKLSEVLADFGMSLNTKKTSISDQIITNALKADKLGWLNTYHPKQTLQKQFLSCYILAQKHPNSGKINLILQSVDKDIRKSKKYTKEIRKDIYVLISILIGITLKNPKTYDRSCSIISILFNSLEKKDERKEEIINKILNRVKETPNAEYLEIWIQRILIKSNLKEPEYTNILCKMVKDKINNRIWPSEWLRKKELKEIIYNTSIINTKILTELPEIIDDKEVDIFKYY